MMSKPKITTVDPTHVIKLDILKIEQFALSAPAQGKRFVVKNGDKALVFDVLKKIGEFTIEKIDESVYEMHVHPNKDIVALRSLDIEPDVILFVDFNGNEIHRFEFPSEQYCPWFGFEQSGSFFFARQSSSEMDSIKLATWANDAPIETYGKIDLATDCQRLENRPTGKDLKPSPLGEAIQLEDGWIGLLSGCNDARDWLIRFKTLANGKLEIGETIRKISNTVAFSKQGPEYIVSEYDYLTNKRWLRRYEKVGKKANKKLKWKTQLGFYGPDNSYYIDSKFAIFTNCDDGRIFLVNTQSMTFEGELKIKGYTNSWGAVQYGDYLLLIWLQVMPAKSKLNLVFVDHETILKSFEP